MTAHARIKCTIWRDEDFRDLTVDAQWLYQRLLSDSNRNQAGVLALTRKRWVGSAAGMTTDRLDAALDELVVSTFIVLDEDTEEVLVRSYIRHNDIALQPNILKAALKQAARVESPILRAALAHELRLLPAKLPDTARISYPDPHVVAEEIDPGDLGPRLSVVREARARRDVSAGRAHPSKGSANPSANPSGKTGEKEQELVTGSGGVRGGVSSALAVQSPLMIDISVPEPPRPDKSRGTRLPEGWLPSDEARAWTLANADGVDVRAELSKFQDYWLAKPGAAGRKVNWDATWRNWVRRAAEMRPAATRKPDGTRVAPIDQRVHGMLSLAERYEREEALASQQKAIHG